MKHSLAKKPLTACLPALHKAGSACLRSLPMKTGFCVATMVFLSLTISFAGLSHASDLVRKPLRFVDEDGMEIDSYCVAPVYSKYNGFALLGKGREWDGSGYLMWPTTVKEGERGYYQKLRTKKPSTVMILGVTFGESIGVSGVLLLKAGRAPFLQNTYLDLDQTKTVVFSSGDSNAAIDLLTSEKVDQDAIRSLYKLPSHWNVVNSYTKEEKELLRQCYK